MAIYRLENSDKVLFNVHAPGTCYAKNSCAVHNKSDHSMRSFKQVFRSDAGFMERQCKHGVGHPDPDDVFAPSVHGCDGCCV